MSYRNSEDHERVRRDFYKELIARTPSLREGYALDVGSNDGTFLQPFARNGFCLLKKEVLNLFLDSNFHFEEEIFPKLIAEKQLTGFMTDERYYSIATPERIKVTEQFLATEIR